MVNNRSKKIEQNTEAIIRLTTKMEFIIHAVEDMPKVKRDVQSAHEKIREFNQWTKVKIIC